MEIRLAYRRQSFLCMNSPLRQDLVESPSASEFLRNIFLNLKLFVNNFILEDFL